ncbi:MULTISPECIES: hypothetical protein [unclassified Sphingomonas]|uniref:hypothetical protein n=1 Tax=unclassified Sphingomonas TaxID=196159 RepID=UPI0021515DD9|nr:MULTISPECIES: hypothetical protein [unclassified Sphingomonas]MCR5870650.1 hypothetical protein [Sphingomonas sp. J344]UUY01011.1 hypothetical protein LRS08_08140 [Sphingomonas sp. J315]
MTAETAMAARQATGATMKTSRSSLNRHVGELAGSSAFLMYLADAGNARLSLSQAAFFFLAATGAIRGVPLTLFQIMEGAGSDALARSVKNTYKVFLEPSPRNPNGLGWLTREINPDDEREKLFTLTPKGEEVVRAALLAMAPLDRANA